MTTTSKPVVPFDRESAKHRENMIAPRKSLGLYIHVPFCVRKCNYCDFLSFGGVEEEVQKEYFQALTKEIRQKAIVYSNEYYVDSIFIGGGTPSLVSEKLITDVMTTVKESFLIDENAEISIESNPKTLTKNKLTAYLDAGVNRLSIGAQSFDNELLAYMGRVHTREDFTKNYELARECGFRNINIDLMFAIPGQTKETWMRTMRSALALDPEHISFYSLQIEEGTPFYTMFQDGSLKQAEDELDREMYHGAIGMMKDRGYIHYEISNAAREGYQCRHNLKYWSLEDYLGLGLGAHSYHGGTRTSNTADMREYIRTAGSCDEWRHENTKEDDITEYLITGMRKLEGIDLRDFERKFQRPIEDCFPDNWKTVERYIAEGYLTKSGNNLRFTIKGIDISNTILREFV